MFLSIQADVKANHRFESFSTEKGIAGRLVRDTVQDKQGFLWFATGSGLSRYDGYEFKNFYHDASNPNSLSSNNLWRLHVDANNTLWISSTAGLDRFDGVSFIRLLKNDDYGKSATKNINAITSLNDLLYVATSVGIVTFPINENRAEAQQKHLLANEPVLALTRLTNDRVVASTENGLYVSQTLNGTLKGFKLWLNSAQKELRNIRRLYTDPANNIWAANKSSLYKINSSEESIAKVYPEISQFFVTDLVFQNDSLWIGTLKNGLFKIDTDSGIENFIYNDRLNDSIQDNVIASLYVDSSDTLWVGTFNAGVSFRNSSINSFELFRAGMPQLHCLKSREFEHFHKNPSGVLYVGNGTGIYELELQKKNCKQIDFSALNSAVNVGVFSAYSLTSDSLFIGSSIGLLHYNKSNSQLKKIASDKINSSVYSIHHSNGILLVGTRDGVFSYNLTSEEVTTLQVKNNFGKQNVGVNQIVELDSDTFLLASDHGLLKLELKLNQEQEHEIEIDSALEYVSPGGHEALSSPINSLLVDADAIWLGNNDNKSLFQFTHEGKLIAEYPLKESLYTDLNSSVKPLSMIADGNVIWIGTNAGLFRFDKETKTLRKFVTADGLQGENFVRNAAYRDKQGRIYFGGRNGFNVFRSKDIKINHQSPKVVLTELRRFNKLVEPGVDKALFDGFGISTPIEVLPSLEIGHRDRIMSIQFSGLHFADPTRHRYAYKIDGLHSDWIETDANNRTVALTNMPPGDYVFRAKATNKDGVWAHAKDEANLPIRVNPAPWFSWWAYTSYVVAFLLLVIWVIHYRTSVSIQRAAILENEVKERTQEITQQKVIIESLLERKNTLFANISHEFRTPLTLILGPLEKELNSMDSPKNIKNLQMIQRNANRLLGMVEQILKLAELKKEEAIQKVPLAVEPVLISLVESFRALAESKNIALSMRSSEPGTVLASIEALEVMLGNLISNAIKYTPNGGKVEVWSESKLNYMELTVKDSGVGISQAQQSEIFERFIRLDATSDIAGTGIGLSIVKELVLTHSGKVSVVSEPNQGAAFTLSMPKTDQPASAVVPKMNSIQHLVSVQPYEKVQGQPGNPSLSHPENSLVNDGPEFPDAILIIEDNLDMQAYIQSTLEKSYRCYAAPRGEQGIDMAIQQIPDLIICDVMMPGINGYEVVSRLRKDERTSHIPVILLTAKGDKASRLQGWNENIDGYMTKPFDEVELLARIANILSIRNILRRKNAAEVAAATTKKAAGAANASSNLNSLDKQFVRRLLSEIETYYSDHQYSSTQMASTLAVSPRQLQRKLNALIDKSPMDLLRQYRLKKASELLLEGHQIGVVADKCGFNSLSYFSQCFKAEYGLTPKQHQSRH